MIPEEAVEAATLKLASLNSDAGDQLTDAEWARSILEAAAPHMLAAALRHVADRMRNERANWCLDDSGRYWIGRTLNELTEYADDLRPTP